MEFNTIITDDREDITNLALQIIAKKSDLLAVDLADYSKIAQSSEKMQAIYVDSTTSRDEVYSRLKSTVDKVAGATARQALVQFSASQVDDLPFSYINAILEIVRAGNPAMSIVWGTDSGVHIPIGEFAIFVVYGY